VFIQTESGQVYETDTPEHWPGAKKISARKAREVQKEDAISRLREMFPPGSSVFSKVVHVSRSGMSRRIEFYQIKGGDIFNVTYLLARVLKCTQHKHGGLYVGGCGMDMSFHCVYNLACVLYPNGFGCTGKGCPSSAHSNGDRDYTPHGLSDEAGQPEDREPGPGEEADGCRRHWHNDGGYALTKVSI